MRPKRKLVEKYAGAEAWAELSSGSFHELAKEVAGLPSELDPEGEEAKRFDLLVLRLQLAILRAEPGMKRLAQQVRDIAELLEEQKTIPMVQAELPLIQELQTDEWWQDLTVQMLETVRKRLRLLVKLIEKQKRKPIYKGLDAAHLGWMPRSAHLAVYEPLAWLPQRLTGTRSRRGAGRCRRCRRRR